MRLTYLSVDSLQEGVGASQVLAYVERLAGKGVSIELHTFEKSLPPEALRRTLQSLNVYWKPHPFGPKASVGGVQRVVRGAVAIRGGGLVHARSDLAAASALLARSRTWLWDFRSFYADQKIELEELRAGSLQEKTLHKIEERAARSAAAIVVLTKAAIPVLAQRFGDTVADKTHVITTCVDTKRFTPLEPPSAPPLKLLLSGTVNSYYDVPLMVEFVERARMKLPVEFAVVGLPSARWERDFSVAEALSSVADFEDMPGIVAGHHAGLSVCRDNAGISLKGSMPTKIGEFLASGRPVVVNQGLEDITATIRQKRCGVVIEESSPEGIDAAVDDLIELVHDPDTSRRCRDVAVEDFDLDKATDKLISIYDDINGQTT